SGQYRQITETGTRLEWRAIARVVTQISRLQSPISWDHLSDLLRELESLGPTMKVWSRLLCLARPDLYCTVASQSVRTNLSATLGVSQSSFERSDGYIRLLKLSITRPGFSLRSRRMLAKQRCGSIEWPSWMRSSIQN